MGDKHPILQIAGKSQNAGAVRLRQLNLDYLSIDSLNRRFLLMKSLSGSFEGWQKADRTPGLMQAMLSEMYPAIEWP